MTVKEMHYEFKQKFNAVDSQKQRNFYVPEIDAKLCEAQELIAKLIAQPRFKTDVGLELNQRTIDDIRTIVVDQPLDQPTVPIKFNDNSYIASLPTDYWFYANMVVYASKNNCELVVMRKVTLVQHDDEHEVNPYYRSSFEWREVNIWFNSRGVRIFTDGTFAINKVYFQYVKQPRRIHNAEDWKGGSYTALDGTVLTGTQNCELPIQIHGEVVDVAVMLAAGDLGLSSYAIKKDRLVFNQLQ